MVIIFNLINLYIKYELKSGCPNAIFNASILVFVNFNKNLRFSLF